jgi:hypothetical protein
MEVKVMATVSMGAPGARAPVRRVRAGGATGPDPTAPGDGAVLPLGDAPRSVVPPKPDIVTWGGAWRPGAAAAGSERPPGIVAMRTDAHRRRRITLHRAFTKQDRYPILAPAMWKAIRLRIASRNINNSLLSRRCSRENLHGSGRIRKGTKHSLEDGQ